MSTRYSCPLCQGQNLVKITDKAGDFWFCQACQKEIQPGTQPGSATGGNWTGESIVAEILKHAMRNISGRLMTDLLSVPTGENPPDWGGAAAGTGAEGKPETEGFKVSPMFHTVRYLNIRDKPKHTGEA